MPLDGGFKGVIPASRCGDTAWFDSPIRAIFFPLIWLIKDANSSSLTRIHLLRHKPTYIKRDLFPHLPPAVNPPLEFQRVPRVLPDFPAEKRLLLAPAEPWVPCLMMMYGCPSPRGGWGGVARVTPPACVSTANYKPCHSQLMQSCNPL